MKNFHKKNELIKNKNELKNLRLKLKELRDEPIYKQIQNIKK